MNATTAPSAPRVYNPQGSMIDVWRTPRTVLEILHDGPAGTGKTFGLCHLCHFAAMKYPGARIGWAMAQRVDLSRTILNTYEQLVLPPKCPVLSGARAQNRDEYVYPNGSKIILIGLDDVQRTRGLELDWIVVFEATNVIEGDYETLLRCLRWTGIPYKRSICDTNPDAPGHWLIERVARGSMRRIPASHRDNPRWYDAKAKRWTQEWETVYSKVLGAMSGSRRARLLEGQWVGDERAFFDLDVIQELRKSAQEPWHVGDLIMDGAAVDRDPMLKAGRIDLVRFVPTRGDDEPGPWKFWCDLKRDPKTGRFRPPQDMVFGLAADVSWGQGASNSVIAVGDRVNRRKVAEFASAALPAEDFARVIAMAGHWFGGRRGRAAVIHERNGPGQSVSRVLDDLHYPDVYREAGEAGWWSDQQSKEDLATALRDALRQRAYTDWSKAFLDEAAAWIRFPNNHIGPAKLVRESAAVRAAHGDRVVATMLLVHRLATMPGEPTPEPRKSLADVLLAPRVDREDDDG